MTNQQGAPEALRPEMLSDLAETFRTAGQGRFDFMRVELPRHQWAQLAALVEAQQPDPAPQADSQPAPVRDYPPLPDFDSGDESIWNAIFKWEVATPGSDAHRKANAIESAIIAQLRDYVDADRAVRAPAGSVLEDADRYRYLRDGDWREHEELESVIRLQLNTLWDAKIDAARAVIAKWGAPQQEAQEPCPTCIALARTVMLDQVSFDRKPDCYGIRQITDDEGVEEWEDIRTSPDVAREEANDMMATGRGEIYEVVPLWTTPQPTQAQAVAVPLTDGQVESLLYKYGYDPDDEHMAAMLKEAHGIKGGRHGTE